MQEDEGAAWAHDADHPEPDGAALDGTACAGLEEEEEEEDYGEAPRGRSRGEQRVSEAALAARRILLVKAQLDKREMELGAQMEDKDRKLIAASKALNKSRGQVQRLTAKVGLQDLQTARLEAQVHQLRNLLVEKETRLQDALDEVARLQECCDRGGSSSSTAAAPAAARARGPALAAAALCTNSDGDEDESQPQEAPVELAPGQPWDEEHEEHLLQLAEFAEELAEALQATRESEADARRELAETAERLQEEEERRAQMERDLAAAQQQAQELEARLQVAEATCVRVKELEQRVQREDLEAHLQRAAAQKGKDQKWHPHLEC